MKKYLIILLTFITVLGLCAQTKGSSVPKSFHIEANYPQEDSKIMPILRDSVPMSYSSQTNKPTCKIIYPKNGSTYLTKTIRLQYTANAAPGVKYTLMFYVNGKKIQTLESESLKGARIESGYEIELPVSQDLEHETIISLQMVDSKGTRAEPHDIVLHYVGDKPKPTLHVLAVGVSEYPASDLQNLNYAAKDAQDFIQTIKNSDLSRYQEMQSTLIQNKNATTANIRRQLSQLAQRVMQDDVIMLFFSGHGINHNNERFFLTYDASVEDYYNGLSFNFIRERMSNMVDKHCRVIVFMDACHSGAMFETKGTIKDITFATPGIIGFYSSTASEQSVEMDKLQNGVFTRVLLDGLKGGAVNKNQQITINQLDTYIKQNVYKKTDGYQTPIVENATGDAVLFNVKKK